MRYQNSKEGVTGLPMTSVIAILHYCYTTLLQYWGIAVLCYCMHYLWSQIVTANHRLSPLGPMGRLPKQEFAITNSSPGTFCDRFSLYSFVLHLQLYSRYLSMMSLCGIHHLIFPSFIFLIISCMSLISHKLIADKLILFMPTVRTKLIILSSLTTCSILSNVESSV